MNNLSGAGIVIPAFNEADNLERVLETVCAIPQLAQIIVVDDGSADNTWVIADRFARQHDRLSVLRLAQNQGKGGAMLAGVRSLQTEFVIFVDADLVNMQPDHLLALYEPVAAGACQMSIAVFRHGGLLTDASHLFAPHLTGQRCLRRLDAEQILTPLQDSRYGVETGLTVYAKRHHWQICQVVWRGVTHCMKEQKREKIIGLYSRWQMYRQIIATWTQTARHRLWQRRPASIWERTSEPPEKSPGATQDSKQSARQASWSFAHRA